MTSATPASRTLVHGIAKHVVGFAPSLLVPGLANLALYPAIGRLLDPAALGLFALASGIVAFTPILASNWIESAIYRYGFASGHILSARDRARAGVAATVVAGVAGAGLTAAATGASPALIATCGLGAMVSVSFILSLAPLRAVGSFGRYSLLLAIRAGLGLAGALIGAGAAGVLGAIVGLYAPQIPIALVARRWLPDRTAAPAISIRQAARYGIPLASMNVSASLLSIADRYIIGISQSLPAVASYAAIYVMLEQALRFAPTAISGAVAPTVYREWAHGRRDRAIRIVLAAVGVTLAAVLLLAVAIILTAGWWTSLLGDVFVAGRPLVLPLAIAMVIHAVNQVVGVLYTAREHVGGLALNVGFSALLNVGLNIALIPAFGVVAAAWITVSSYAVLLLLNTVQAWYRSVDRGSVRGRE